MACRLWELQMYEKILHEVHVFQLKVWDIFVIFTLRTGLKKVLAY